MTSHRLPRPVYCPDMPVTMHCLQQAPYKFKDKDPLKTIGRNLNRVAEVWMDEYADIYYATTGNRDLGAGNATELAARTEFRREHECKSFAWYLENVYPDLDIPKDKLVSRT